jgi:hypothetical protein
MAHFILFLAAAQRIDSCLNSRSPDPHCSLLFPGDDILDEGPDNDGAWRKGKLSLGGDYWWRETGNGPPEISLRDPTDEWKVGVLDEGREYFWREREDSPDDPEVRLARYTGEEPGESSAGPQWRIGTLPSGRKYLWRETDDPDDPEVQWWTESTMEVRCSACTCCCDPSAHADTRCAVLLAEWRAILVRRGWRGDAHRPLRAGATRRGSGLNVECWSVWSADVRRCRSSRDSVAVSLTSVGRGATVISISICACVSHARLYPFAVTRTLEHLGSADCAVRAPAPPSRRRVAVCSRRTLGYPP